MASQNASGQLSPMQYTVNGQTAYLDWYYVDTQQSANSQTDVVTFSGTVTTPSLLNPNANPGDHIVFAINCEGAATHGPNLVAHGYPLFDQARGFYVCKGVNQVFAEHWRGGGQAPGVAPLGTDDAVNSGLTTVRNLNIATASTLHFRIRAGHRSGPMAERMELELRNGGPSGTLLFKSFVPWGWSRGTGPIRCSIGYIQNPPAGSFPRTGDFNVTATL